MRSGIASFGWSFKQFLRASCMSDTREARPGGTRKKSLLLCYQNVFYRTFEAALRPPTAVAKERKINLHDVFQYSSEYVA